MGRCGHSRRRPWNRRWAFSVTSTRMAGSSTRIRARGSALPMAGRHKIAAALIAATVVIALALPALGATAQKKQSARALFEQAETARRALLEKSIADRKLAEYQAILKLYRNVTILAPTIHQAPDSLFYSAELNKEL